jgi:hypothetical protein
MTRPRWGRQSWKAKEHTIEIKIPKGMRAGNTLAVNLPDGRSVEQVVPEGMREGNTLTIKYRDAV